MRVFSMLRTYDSMNLLNRKLRDDAGYVKPGMMINYFQMMTSPDYTDRQMVVKMKVSKVSLTRASLCGVDILSGESSTFKQLFNWFHWLDSSSLASNNILENEGD